MNAPRKPQRQAPTGNPTPTPSAPLGASQGLDNAHRYDHLIERCPCGAWTWRPGECGTCIALATRLLTEREAVSLDAARRTLTADRAEVIHRQRTRPTRRAG